jgi:hypothetical protein
MTRQTAAELRNKIAWAMLAIGLGIAASILFGCTDTRAESATVERTQGTQAGQPTDLTTVRQTKTNSTTTVDLGPAVTAAISAGLGDIRGAIKAIAERPAPPTAPSIAEISKAVSDIKGNGLDVGTTAGGAALALLALREYLASRKNGKDADEAWDVIKQQAITKSPDGKT